MTAAAMQASHLLCKCNALNLAMAKCGHNLPLRYDPAVLNIVCNPNQQQSPVF